MKVLLVYATSVRVQTNKNKECGGKGKPAPLPSGRDAQKGYENRNWED